MKPNLPDGLHYRFLDFPQLPKELEQQCLDRVKQKEHFLFDLGADLNKRILPLPYYGKLVKKQQCIFEVFDAPVEVRQWLYDNSIIDNVKLTKVGVQRSYGGNVLLPHIDQVFAANGSIRARQYALNYLLTDSGPKTCFYNSQRIDAVEESVVIPKSYWHLLEVKHFHGVEDIKWDRISLSITIDGEKNE